jgi:hypothetical protein
MADRYLVWGLVSVVVVLSIVFAFAGFRRRIERGRPARFHFGFGVLALLVGLSVLLLRRGLV